MSFSTLTRKGQVIQRTILDLQGAVKPKRRPESFEKVRREVAAARGRTRVEKPDA